MNLKQLIEMRNAKVEELKKLVDGAVTETRALSEEENTKVAALEKEISDLDATIKTAEAVEKRSLTEYAAAKKAEPEKRSKAQMWADIVHGRNVETRDGEPATAYNTGTDGVLIPVELSKDIIKSVTENSDLVHDIALVNLKGTYKQIVEKGKPTAGWVDELAAVTESKGEYDTIDISHYKLGALAKLSLEILNESDVDLANEVEGAIIEAFEEKLEEAIFKGNGVKKPTGLAKIVANETKVFELASATAITADELIDIKNSVKSAYRKGAVWRMNSVTLGAIEKLKNEDGEYLFRRDLNGEFEGSLLGYPVKCTDAAPDMAANATPIIFGNMKKAYKGNMYPAMRVQVLREVYATQGAIGILGFLFFDGKPINNEAYVVVQSKTSA